MNAFVLRAYCGYILLQNTLKRKRVIERVALQQNRRTKKYTAVVRVRVTLQKRMKSKRFKLRLLQFYVKISIFYFY